MTRYGVTAKRWDLGWELHIEGFGVTQAATLASAGRMVRDYLGAVTGTEPGEIEIDYRIELDDDELAAEIEAARQASREAERLQREAAERWRAIARQLSKDRRMTGADVAAVLNVSPQRVSQLLNS